MPATTGVSAVPSTRPSGEISGAVAPMYRLTEAARGSERNGKTELHIAAVIDAAQSLGLPGLIVGGRAWGADHDPGIEPLLGYRHRAGERMSIAGVGYGTHMRADHHGAHYRATRIGAEASTDLRVADLASWLALHGQAAVQATYLEASGRYCYDGATGNGADCAEDGSVPFTYGKLSGVYPAATLSLAIEARRTKSVFHHVRLGMMVAAGFMPRLIRGVQQAGDPYISGGLQLTWAFGAPE